MIGVHPVAVAAGLLEAGTGDLHDVGGGAVGVNGDAELSAERFELIHRRRTINVRCHEQGRAPLLLQQLGEFRLNNLLQ